MRQLPDAFEAIKKDHPAVFQAYEELAAAAHDAGPPGPSRQTACKARNRDWGASRGRREVTRHSSKRGGNQ